MGLLIWPSPAKLNLFLHINNQRNDGYHELQTLFQFLNYKDEIVIKLRKDNKINLFTSCEVIKRDNLVLKSAYLLQNYCIKNNLKKKYFGANIFLKKNIPIGGGLGGGSSNAATTLIALNYLWKSNICDILLEKIGVQIGSDVPVFIKGFSSFGEGVGDILSPVFPKEKWYLVVYPKVLISTKKIFSDPELKRNSPKKNLKFLLKNIYSNDCESVVRKRFYKIDKIFSFLSKYSVPRLTGTGSCVFSEFENEKEANKILQMLPKWVDSFVSKGMNCSLLRIFYNNLYK